MGLIAQMGAALSGRTPAINNFPVHGARALLSQAHPRLLNIQGHLHAWAHAALSAFEWQLALEFY